MYINGKALHMEFSKNNLSNTDCQYNHQLVVVVAYQIQANSLIFFFAFLKKYNIHTKTEHYLL